jgi:hypothetical protein
MIEEKRSSLPSGDNVDNADDAVLRFSTLPFDTLSTLPLEID